MPIVETHPAITVPNSNITLWRYMDIPAFLSMLVTSSLTFVRADLFEDKYEGKLPKLTAQMIDQVNRMDIADGRVHPGYWNLSQLLNSGNKTTYVNCWCKEAHEMVHMWKIYSKESGIAVETDYSRLKESLETPESVYPTEIRYVDFENEVVNWKANGMTVFTLKRKEYKSENEFRLILSHPRVVEDQLQALTISLSDGVATASYRTNEELSLNRKELYMKTPVINCKVDCQKLISRIRVSPYAPKWYMDVITDVTKKYDLSVSDITQSEL